MKIIQLVSNKCWGGGERYALDLSRTLAADGVEVEVLTKGIEAVDTPFREAGLTLGRLPLGGEFDILSPIMLSRKLRRDPARRIVVHVHNFKDASTAIKARSLCGGSDKDIRIVCTRHLAKAGKCSPRSKAIFAGIDALVFISEYTRREFLSSAPEIDPGKLHTVYNSIIPPAGQAAAGKSDSEITLICLGRLVADKGVDILIRALGLLKDLPVRLRIGGVGVAPYVKTLKDEAWRAGVTDRVEWLGHLDDVYPEIRKADIGVMPSRWGEPFGLVLLEFMSQGLPVITTGNGAQPEIVADGREGFIVAPDNPQAMADAIRRLAADATLRRTMGEAARTRYLSEFGYDRFYRAIRAVYDKVFA